MSLSFTILSRHLSNDNIIIFLFTEETKFSVFIVRRYQRRVHGRRILITGGCGFLGSEISSQLNDLGANITILDNLSSGNEEYIQSLTNVKLIKGDVTDEATVESVTKEQEYVVHLVGTAVYPGLVHIS